MAAEDERLPQAGGPARLAAGFGFLYTLVVTVSLLALEDFFRDEPNSDAMLLWLLVPVISAFSACLAVRSGFAPLRGWIWLGTLATAFCCWIAAFSYGPWFVPLPLLLIVAAVSPWDRRGSD